MKKCNICQLTKHPSDFPKKYGFCKSCYRERYADDVRRYDLKRRYGVTTDQFDALYSTQGGRCSICKKHQSEINKNLSVDHDHKTGKVRGLLCNPCNIAIGNFEDDIERILSAAKYLKEHL